MNVLEHLHERIQIVDGEPSYGGEDVVNKAVETSPVPLPEDYIEFLRSISGRICRQTPADPIPLSSRSSPPHILKKSKSGKGFLLPYDYVVISLKPQFHVI